MDNHNPVYCLHGYFVNLWARASGLRNNREEKLVCTRKFDARRGWSMPVLLKRQKLAWQKPKLHFLSGWQMLLQKLRLNKLSLNFCGVVALGESLVFNVASQKNAISDGFYPFIVGAHHVSRSNWRLDESCASWVTRVSDRYNDKRETRFV